MVSVFEVYSEGHCSDSYIIGLCLESCFECEPWSWKRLEPFSSLDLDMTSAVNVTALSTVSWQDDTFACPVSSLTVYLKYSLRTIRVGLCSSNAHDSYFAGTQFEYWPSYCLYQQVFLCLSSVYPGKCWDYCSKMGHDPSSLNMTVKICLETHCCSLIMQSCSLQWPHRCFTTLQVLKLRMSRALPPLHSLFSCVVLRHPKLCVIFLVCLSL